MDVADFLELERAFERERIVGAAAEVEHIARGGDEMRHRGDILIMRESGVERGGRLDQMLDDLTLVGGAKLALPEREVRGERGADRQSVVSGQGVAVSVDVGGRGIIQKTKIL